MVNVSVTKFGETDGCLSCRTVSSTLFGEAAKGLLVRQISVVGFNEAVQWRKIEVPTPLNSAKPDCGIRRARYARACNTRRIQ